MNVTTSKYCLIYQHEAKTLVVMVGRCVKYRKPDLDVFIAQNTIGEAA